MPLTLDLHTHSTASADGGITVDEYEQAFSSGVIDCVAVTDHNTIEFAQQLYAIHGPERVIIGEEITTIQGDIIGLFLSTVVTPGQDITDAIDDIKSQGGLVYIPHPFETVRKGITLETLTNIADTVDIIETMNGRAYFQNYSQQTHEWAQHNNVPGASSSDAHSHHGLGSTYMTVSEPPTLSNLATLVARAQHSYAKPSIRTLLAPKLNKSRKLLAKAWS